MSRRATIPLAVLLLAPPAIAGQKAPKNNAPKSSAAKPAAPRENAAKRPPEQRQIQENGGRGINGQQRPVDRAIEKLQQMTPEQREKWLSNLPPERRQRIERALQNVAKMPPATQNRVMNQLERLNSLPPQKQGQVRRSLQQFNTMPVERKAVINQELERMRSMPDDERRAHMNSEEFRNRYSPTEQQMMSNLTEILPQ